MMTYDNDAGDGVIVDEDVAADMVAMLKAINGALVALNVKVERIAQIAERGALPAAPAVAKAQVWPTGPISDAPPAWSCPEHGPGRLIAAGISQRTGKAYKAFWTCAERDCPNKPPR